MSDPSSRSKPWAAPLGRRGPTAQVTELKDLVVSYAKQETVDPLKTLLRYLGFGIAGAVCIGTGWIFGLLALLRGLQQIDALNDPMAADGGRWAWVPYTVVTITGIIVAALYGRLVQVRMQENGVQLSQNGVDK